MYCGSGEVLEEFRSAEAVYGPSKEPYPSISLQEAAVATPTVYEERSGTGTALNDFEHSFEDREEAESIRIFFSSSCCKLGPSKGPCYKQFSQESILRAREESLELEHDELDLVILSHLLVHRSSPSDKTELKASHLYLNHLRWYISGLLVLLPAPLGKQIVNGLENYELYT